MSEQEFLQILDNIANRLAAKFKFGYHEIEDLKQQAKVFALEGVSRYNPETGPLENFLWTHVRNRLFNFKRDNYFRPNSPCDACDCETCDPEECSTYKNWVSSTTTRCNLMRPIPIYNVDMDDEQNMYYHKDVLRDIDRKVVFKLLDKHIPLDLRRDYLRWKHGLAVSKPRRILIQQVAQQILETNGINTQLEETE
jgi:hypothetical protein